MMKTSKKRNDFVDLLLPGGNKKDYFNGRPVASVHDYYLSGHIESSEKFIDWFDSIRNCGENDIIRIHINSYGGDLFTAIQMMRVLSETSATVVISVEGACMSAATMIFMCADMYEISPHSMFMFHNYSGGTFGKGGEMFEQLKHERSWSEKLLREVYADFLTEKEIQQMLDNKDLWMDGDEVVVRLEKKAKKVSRSRKAAKAEKTEEE